MATDPGPSGTVERLLRAAELEMAAHGIYGADLKVIQAVAGQRNKSAINYHFGGRDGLVEAIGVAHRADIDRRRTALLDRLEADGTTDLGALAAALVELLSQFGSTTWSSAVKFSSDGASMKAMYRYASTLPGAGLVS